MLKKSFPNDRQPTHPPVEREKSRTTLNLTGQNIPAVGPGFREKR